MIVQNVKEIMKLLFLLTYYYPYWTGLTQYAKSVAEGLAERNFNVKVITTQHKKNLKRHEVINKVQVIRKPIILRISRTLVSLELIFSLWREIKKADSVIVFLPLAEVAIIAIIAKILRKKLILIHNADILLPKGFGNKVIEKLYFYNTSFAIFLSTQIIIHTKDYAENSKLLSRYRRKWVVIIPPFKKQYVKENLLTYFKKRVNKDGANIVGFAGRFAEEKGFDLLLKAIPLIIKKLPNTRFVFAGETNMIYEDFFQQNQDLIKKNIKHLKLLGLLNREQMAAFYKLCDVIVISSRRDCFPFVQAESMLAGVPVVVTNIPGARWLVQQTGMGKIVKANNIQALADGIIEILKNPGKYFLNSNKVNCILDYEKSMSDYIKLINRET